MFLFLIVVGACVTDGYTVTVGVSYRGDGVVETFLNILVQSVRSDGDRPQGLQILGAPRRKTFSVVKRNSFFLFSSPFSRKKCTWYTNFHSMKKMITESVSKRVRLTLSRTFCSRTHVRTRCMSGRKERNFHAPPITPILSLAI